MTNRITQFVAQIPITFLVILSALFSTSNIAKAELLKSDSVIVTKSVNIEAEANYLRRYVWRGINFGSDHVSQSFVSFGYKKMAMNLSVNCNLFPKNQSELDYTKPTFYDEQDLQFTFADSIHQLMYEFSSNTYFYFHQINCANTSELNLKLMYPLGKNFIAYTDNAIDVWAYKRSIYSCSGGEANITLFDKIDAVMQVYGAVGNRHFNMAYNNFDKFALNFVGTHIELSMPVLKNYYLKVFSEYNQTINKAMIVQTSTNYTFNYGLAFGKDLSIALKHKVVKR
jgi:hypothetical protein